MQDQVVVSGKEGRYDRRGREKAREARVTRAEAQREGPNVLTELMAKKPGEQFKELEAILEGTPGSGPGELVDVDKD